MPYSNTVHREAIHKWFLDNWVPSKCIIDIGPGAGHYAGLLHGYYNISCIEVWGPYVMTYGLPQKYAHVIVADVRNIGAETYLGNVVIMGDVLEHLSVEDARATIHKIKSCADALLIAVPYLYEQGPDHPDTIKFGNPHEVHLQPDLTHEIFMERYPKFEVLVRNDQIGVYVWRPS